MGRQPTVWCTPVTPPLQKCKSPQGKNCRNHPLSFTITLITAVANLDVSPEEPLLVPMKQEGPLTYNWWRLKGRSCTFVLHSAISVDARTSRRFCQYHYPSQKVHSTHRNSFISHVSSEKPSGAPYLYMLPHSYGHTSFCLPSLSSIADLCHALGWQDHHTLHGLIMQSLTSHQHHRSYMICKGHHKGSLCLCLLKPNTVVD